MKIGFIGLGAMGAPMLARLAEAGETFGHDTDAARMAAVCAETGAAACGSVAEIAGAVDVLFTCLPSNDVVREVYLGDGGVAAHLREGAVSIDVSTIAPEVARNCAEAVAKRGASHLDAGMLGSVSQAEAGIISFVVGGDAAALETARPALMAVGGLIRHCGGPGAGMTMKLLHQTLVAGHAVAVGEALALAEATGADMDLFHEIVTEGAGFAYSRYFEKRGPRIRAGDFSPLFMLRFMAKDARLARDMASGEATGLNAVIEVLEAGEKAGLGDEDFSAAYKIARKRRGL